MAKRSTRRPAARPDPATALEQLRAVVRELPGAEERLSWSVPVFCAGGRQFAIFADDHHGDGRLALWVAAAPGVQAEMVDEEPDRFFVPPYVGHRGWLGVRLDRDPDWDEVAGVCADAFRHVAPKTLAARLDADAQEDA